jgi:prepilin-type N-terminal cleavage/methylation domain-containing protein
MTPTLRARRGRQGFTLLEMTLALAIGLILMSAIYFTIDIYLQSTRNGRQQIDQATVARSVVKKINADVLNSIATLPQYPTPSNSKNNAGTGGTTTAGGTTTTAGGATTTTTTTTGNTTGGTTTTGNTTTGNTTGGTTTTGNTTTTVGTGAFLFNSGLQGTPDVLTLYVSKVSLSNSQMTGDSTSQGTQPVDCDLRRISYWVITDGDRKGLVRQEVVWVTNDDDINSVPPDVSLPTDPSDKSVIVVAPEVLGIQFQYSADGQTWVDNWDGTSVDGTPGNAPQQGQLPIGPPMSIKITLKIGTADGKVSDVNDPAVLTVEHIIHIPTSTANGQNASTGG